MFLALDEICAEQSLSFLCGIILSETQSFQHKKQETIQKIANWKCGIVLISTGVFFLAVKQLPVVRQAPHILFCFVQLLIKLPCGLGICFIVTSLLRSLNMRFFYYVGAFAYELYLVHGHVLPKVTVSIPGALTFVVVSIIMTIMLWYLNSRTRQLQRKFLRI